jgi:hypothetical protein
VKPILHGFSTQHTGNGKKIESIRKFKWFGNWSKNQLYKRVIVPTKDDKIYLNDMWFVHEYCQGSVKYMLSESYTTWRNSILLCKITNGFFNLLVT